MDINNTWQKFLDSGESGNVWITSGIHGGGKILVKSTETGTAPADDSGGFEISIPTSNLFSPFNAETAMTQFYVKCVKEGSTSSISVNKKTYSPTEVSNTPKSAFDETRIAQFNPMCAWMFPRIINPALTAQSTANGGSVSLVDNFATLSTGTDSAGMAMIRSAATFSYVPGVGGLVRFTTIFVPPQENSQQLQGLGDLNNGWFFGYDGLDFGICRISSGVQNWYYQPGWNHDEMSELDQTKGNVYQFRFQWLGFGKQIFSIEDGSGNLKDVHTILYANQHTQTSVFNPSGPLSAYVINNGNTSDMILKTPSAVAGIDGTLENIMSVVTSDDVQVTIPEDVETALIEFIIPTDYLGDVQYYIVKALRLTFFSEGGKPCVFRVYGGGATTGGTEVDMTPLISFMKVNKTMTGFTPGLKTGVFSVGKSSGKEIDLTIGRGFRGFSGQRFIITAESSRESEVSVSLSMEEIG